MISYIIRRLVVAVIVAIPIVTTIATSKRRTT